MLTRQSIDAMPGDGATHKDERVTGLTLRDGSRAKTWYLVVKRRGKTEKIKLGTWPEMGISDARAAARKEAAGSTAPAKYNPTLRQVFDRWAEERGALKRSFSEDRRKMDTTLAWLGTLPIADITPARIRDLRERLRDTPVLFNRSRSLLATLFVFSRRKLEIDVENAAAAVDRYEESPRRVKIPIEKAPAFFEALRAPGIDPDVADIVTILLLCGQRKSNVFAMRRQEIDLEAGVWTIPAATSKNGREMVVPLAPEVVDILRRRLRSADRGAGWVFPQKRAGVNGSTGGHIADIRKPFSRICRQIGHPDLTLHDLRRTFGTWMLNAGASIEQVSAALHHSSIRVTETVYAEVLTKTVRQGVDLMRNAIQQQKSRE